MFVGLTGSFSKCQWGFFWQSITQRPTTSRNAEKPIGKQMKCNIQGVNLLLRRVQRQGFVYRIKCEDAFAVMSAWLNSAGAEVSECTAVGNKTGPFERVPNLQTCQGDINGISGSPAPPVIQREKLQMGPENRDQQLMSIHFALQPGGAVSMRLTGHAGLRC